MMYIGHHVEIKKKLHLIRIALESLCITVYNELNLYVLEFIFMFFSDRIISISPSFRMGITFY